MVLGALLVGFETTIANCRMQLITIRSTVVLGTREFPETWIPYQLHTPASVRLSIYDVRGTLVREIDLGYRAAGQYLTSASAAHWDGRDHHGQRVASGVYLYP